MWPIIKNQRVGFVYTEKEKKTFKKVANFSGRTWNEESTFTEFQNVSFSTNFKLSYCADISIQMTKNPHFLELLKQYE